ncbi:hypothetical protein ACWJJH_08930 [Endozoicomonadaceae bacterium StTr2]
MPFRIEQQGSKQARFLFCPDCGDLVAVTCQIGGENKGTVNARFLGEYPSLREAVPVSPKVLSPREKRTRWRQAWMSVTIAIQGV